MLNQAIFNSTKNYENTPIFLGESRGLIDTITRQYPRHTELYERLRGQDWTEKEFEFDICKVELKTCDPVTARKLTSTIGFQWETDSTASNTIAGIMACFCSSSEVFTGYQRISDNESIHALTYAKIVQQSYDDPSTVLARFKADKQALERLGVVAAVFDQAFVSAHRWALYKSRPDIYPLTEQERYDIYDHVFLYVVAILVMERIQFMASFAVTFGICAQQMFQPIGDAVQKIATDELEIHVPFGRATIEAMLRTDRGRESFKNNRHLIAKMIDEAVEAEVRYVEWDHQDGEEIVGAPPSSLITFAHYGGTDVASFLGVREDVHFPMVEDNNLPYMAKRVNLSSVQASPQEAPQTSYMTNALTRNDAGVKLDFDFDFE